MRGRVVEAGTGVPVAGAVVTATAPAQTASTTTDASGNFSFISLAPDTYTVTAAKTGYDSQSQPGISIFVDQSNTVSFSLNRVLKTIATTRSQSAASLLHSGVTSDVYSINPAGQKAAAALGGAGSMNQAYGAIASAPGVNIPSGQEGWYQGVYIRGGDIDQVAYEFDGLPTTRQSDLAPIATLTSLGNQEVQVYTGGTPASSNSSGLAGYINQVIKTGTHPGYASGDLGIGAPSFYHSATAEVSGATPDRLFSYYVGLSGTNQSYRYGDQFNGAGNPLYFYPLIIPTGNAEYNILDGSGGPGPDYGAVFSPGQSYAQATNFDRENIFNVHFAIPHHNSPLRDDIQALYVTGGIATKFYSSQNEIGINPATAGTLGFGYPLPFLDGNYYNGQLMQAPNPNQISTGLFPSSPSQRDPFTGFIQPNQRDASSNDYSIAKLQYQKNINDHSYARVVGYTEYSDWFINGPTSAQLTFGAQLADYEVLDHTYGVDLIYSNQLSPKHLITAQGTFMTQTLQTYNATFSSTDSATTSLGATGLGTILSSYVGNNGLCYNWSTGAQWSCFDGNGSGSTAVTPSCPAATFGAGCFVGSQGGLQSNGSINLTPGTAPAGSAAAKADAHWVMTENGASAQVDNVRPLFSSYSLTDLWQPNDKLVVNLGVRFDHFAYATADLQSGYPARAFWFNAYNNEFCGSLGKNPQWRWNGTGFGACAAGLSPLSNPGNGLYNVPAGLFVNNVFQPRVSATWTLNPNTVIRGSYGKYARAEASSYYQYNTVQQNLASFLGQFYSYGYRSPDHAIYPDTSNNFDLSLEKRVKGTAISYKITPFYRSTNNQIQYLAIDALGGTLAGLNIGAQRSYGVELSLQDGDFSRNGLSALFSYTYTNSKVRYSPINGQSVIDSFNTQIALYNSYTSSCAGVTPSSRNWAACGSGQYAGNASPTLLNGPPGPGTLSIPNPYYGKTLQPLMDTGAYYSPYDAIPTPFNAGNGYEVPNVATLILNYKHDRFAITPTIRWDDGSNYGSPLVWPGYVPQSCAAQPSATPTTPGVSCPGSATQGAIFLPDPYTGRFDSLGSLRDPSELSLNLQASYDVTPRISITASAVNLYHQCFQRGYAWDNSLTCSYSNLPSNILAPAGNFLTHPPVQVAYPYGTFFDITEVGASSVVQPFNFFVNVNVKL